MAAPENNRRGKKFSHLSLLVTRTQHYKQTNKQKSLLLLRLRSGISDVFAGFSDGAVVLANKAELSVHLRHVTLFVWSSGEEFSTPRTSQRARLNSCCQDTGESGSVKKHHPFFFFFNQREDVEPHWACSIMQRFTRIKKVKPSWRSC